MKHKQRSRGDGKAWKLTFVGGSDLKPKPEKINISNNFKAGSLLSEARVGQRVKAIAIEDTKEMRRFLASQGLKPGIELQVESLTKSGSVTVIVGGRLLGLGAVIARNIIVTFSDEDKPQH